MSNEKDAKLKALKLNEEEGLKLYLETFINRKFDYDQFTEHAENNGYNNNGNNSYNNSNNNNNKFMNVNKTFIYMVVVQCLDTMLLMSKLSLAILVSF